MKFIKTEYNIVIFWTKAGRLGHIVFIPVKYNNIDKGGRHAALKKLTNTCLIFAIFSEHLKL